MKTAKKRTTKVRKSDVVNGFPAATSLSELYRQAETDPHYQRWLVAAGENLGWSDGYGFAGKGKRAGSPRPQVPLWQKAHQFLNDYWGSLVGEYGVSEARALQELLDEINFVRDCVE